MSLPYPYDRARARQDRGEQPYKDAREAMAEKEALLQGQAEAFSQESPTESDEERQARLEGEAEARLRGIQADVAGSERGQ